MSFKTTGQSPHLSLLIKSVARSIPIPPHTYNKLIYSLQYSGWTPSAKALYVGVRVTFVFQSRYDTVVELIGVKDGEEEDKEKPKDTQEM